MFDFLITGGLAGMLVISILGVCAILLAVYNLISFLRKKKVTRLQMSAILYLGSMSLFVGLLWNALGLYQVLDVIQSMKEISFHAVAGGLKVSLIGTLWGALLFLLSYLFWFLLRVKFVKNEG